MKMFLIGGAIQALITGLLMYFAITNINPMQQVISAILLLCLIAAISFLEEKRP